MKPELLMPAGDREKMSFAFQYGADAVYAGVPMFSLRARENKFDIDSVAEGVEYAHSLGKKIYLTINIFPHNYKIPVLSKALKKMAELKPDAFIVADAGVISLCKEYAPKVPLHLSVQANNVNWASARFWHQQGVERIILSREITLKEIQEIHEKNPTLELESFVHGSICMAYSGRCLLSNYFSYRDANQGTCAHSCRWEYKVHKAHSRYDVDADFAKEKGYKDLDGDYYLEEIERPGQYMRIDEDVHGTYIMNAKDLCLIEYLKDLRDAGVMSFKVEGRNKSVYYAAVIARAYRRALDDLEKGKPFDERLLGEVAKTANRGFIAGFLMNNPREQAQKYASTLSNRTAECIGVVVDSRQHEGKIWYEVEVKGRLEEGEEVEIMTPYLSDKGDTHCTIKEILSCKTGKRLTAMHPGQPDHVLVELPGKIEHGTMLRKLVCASQ